MIYMVMEVVVSGSQHATIHSTNMLAKLFSGGEAQDKGRGGVPERDERSNAADGDGLEGLKRVE
jgi:hypothetical protein